MTIFASYARYYDLLYRDKDYAGEVRFVDQLIRQSAPSAKTILELGCGTGVHASLLAEQGYQVAGVDQSEDMLSQAQQRQQQLPAALAAQLKFLPGDVRSVRLPQTFDVVVSLFHVISYQTRNQDLQAAFATARAHLQPGGIFIFDCWYGPAVLHDPPVVRVKRLADQDYQLVRIAEPTVYPNLNRVDVSYHILLRSKEIDMSGGLQTQELQELHQMRYLFAPEVELLAQQHGLDVLQAGAWMTGDEPGWDSWSTYFILQCL
jgi:SAM-dependent methyltransferase